MRAGYDEALRGRLREISRERPRWGYRRAHALLLEDGWEINRKRVQRLWREEGLRVPRRRRKRQRLGDSTIAATRLRAERPDQVWALDYQFDQTADGRLLKALHVVDEFTREALAMECRRRIDADATVEVLDRLVAIRGGAPEFIRCDNGPELTAHALKDWCRFSHTGSAYIEPGSPWENPFVESFNARVRDELLTVELFSCLAEAQVLIEAWRRDYNQHHPHSALGMKTPARFAQAWREHPENARPIIHGAPLESRRTPQDAPVDTDTTENRADHVPGGPPTRPAAAELPSPSGLTPPGGGTTTLQPPNHHRLSLQVDR